jgi:hypothetical protein
MSVGESVSKIGGVMGGRASIEIDGRRIPLSLAGFEHEREQRDATDDATPLTD